jgi:hypothetical protein
VQDARRPAAAGAFEVATGGYSGNLIPPGGGRTIEECSRPPGGGAMEFDHSHDDPVVVYRAVAILMAASALALLVLPFDWIQDGARSRDFVTVIAGQMGEWGARLIFAVPCGLLAAIAGRKGWGEDD